MAFASPPGQQVVLLHRETERRDISTSFVERQNHLSAA
jgi:hypothetical protein